jgi:lipid II:glycine glycyltransferase (peptidoglycan interpeptide bridge formation enzyme)
VKLRDEDRILAGAQVLVRSWRDAGGIAYVPKGPLLDGDTPRAEALVDALRRFAAARRVRYMAVQPPMNTYGLERARTEAGFRGNPDIGTHHATVRIDLTRPTSEMLARMRKSTRANVRRAQNRGIVARDGQPSDLDTLYRLLVTELA